MEQYAIVEFIDGLQMIPSSWITKNNKYAYWPTFTSDEKFRKAVQKCISKMDDWPQHEIKRILATASTYEKGIKKLKKAEFISDLNSESEDNDTLKRSRKYRAKTVISSEESLSEEEKRVRVPSYPKVPHKKNLDKQSYENSTIKMPLKNKNVSKLTEYENNNSNINLNKTNVETFSSSINENTGHDFNQNNVKEKEFSSETYETGSTISTTDFQRYVVRKLLDIDFKISTVHEKQKNINTKLDSIQNQIQTFVLDDGVKNKNIEVDYMEFFPLQTLEELEKFEQQLVENKINRKALITQVARIGGTDVKSFTFNILRRLLSDSVGSLYSYIGGKKKRSFFDLYLRKIIFGAVRIYFPETTEQKISEPIKSWLRHASERSMKKKNMDKRADTISTQEDEDQAEEMILN